MEFIGTIVAHIYTSRAQLPVQGATIAVTQKAPGGKHVLLALRTSDESGKTAPIAIPTPAPAAGQAPGAEQPFALCDVWCEAPSFAVKLLENVQVFPNVQTLLEIVARQDF